MSVARRGSRILVCGGEEGVLRLCVSVSVEEVRGLKAAASR